MAAVTLTTALEKMGLQGNDPIALMAAILSCDKGYSGSDGAGIDLTGDATIDCLDEYGFYPRKVYIEGSGNFCFKTLDDNTHVLPVDDKTWITAIIIKEIYEVSHATLATTATGVHVY